MNPAKPDDTAPIKKENAMNTLDSGLFLFATPKIIATAITKTERTRYSALRNAIAPSAILEPMTIIFLVPWSWFSIQLVFQNEKISAKRPATST